MNFRSLIYNYFIFAAPHFPGCILYRIGWQELKESTEKYHELCEEFRLAKRKPSSDRGVDGSDLLSLLPLHARTSSASSKSTRLSSAIVEIVVTVIIQNNHFYNYDCRRRRGLF